MALGIDVGRANVKVHKDGATTVFPSWVGNWIEITLKSYGDYSVEIDGKRYFIGELAAMESAAKRRYATESKIHEDTRTLFLTALAVAGAPTTPFVVTGVPIDQFNLPMKQQMIDLLKGKHSVSIPHDAEPIVFDIRPENVHLFPEGAGVYWAQILDAHGVGVNHLDLLEENVMVIDLGSRTTNVLRMRAGGRYLQQQSFTIPYGCFKLESGPGRKPVTSEEYAALVAAEIAQRLQDDLHDDDLILLGGGGALTLEEAFRGHYKRLRVADSPLEANSIGYARFGVRKQREASETGLIHQ